MDLFNALKALGLVTFTADVEKFLGVFAGPLAIILNAIAIGVVFITVIRIVMIVMTSLNAFNDAKSSDGAGSLDGGADNSSIVLKGSLISILLTLGLALLAFIAVTQGVNLLYSFATGFTNDITAGSQVNAIEKWLGKGSIFTVIMLQVQNFAKIGIVLVGGVILARTLFSALSGSKYETGDNQYTRMSNAIKRAAIVGVITVFGFFAVADGPNQIYNLLTGFQAAGGLDSGTAPVVTPNPSGTPAPTATPAPTVAPTVKPSP